LNDETAQRLFRWFDGPYVCKHEIPTYLSWMQDPQVLGKAALVQSLVGLTAYAFPQIALHPLILMKICRDQCRVLLIAPLWP